MSSFEERFQNYHALPRKERRLMADQLFELQPDPLKAYIPSWQIARRCIVNVLIVTDGSLNFGTGATGLSEFLTAFNALHNQRYVSYRLTLASRGGIVQSTNPLVVNHIAQFKFDTSVKLADFDQIWLFAVASSGNITSNEVTAIEKYMDDGGGLFATGDHGALGKAMCGAIKRVRDMRYWDDTDPSNSVNEVSMTGRRRNDTNQPQPGQSSSFNSLDQADGIPQRIAVRTFTGGNPHPILSVPNSVNPSGLADIMPDHPHEGECKPEIVFNHNGQSISTQILAFSFVVGGNTSGSKTPVDPHAFPSIAVWDGWGAKAGRIVVDSTWHHFINFNVNGAGTPLTGLSDADFGVVRRYYMNIIQWMSRRRYYACIRLPLIVKLLNDSDIVEANLNQPNLPLKEISLADLNSIGALAEVETGQRLGPSFARELLVDMVSEVHSGFAEKMNIFQPKSKEEKGADKQEYIDDWVNYDMVLHTAIGAGFAGLRNHDKLTKEKLGEADEKQLHSIFKEAMAYGYQAAVANLQSEMEKTQRLLG